MNTENKAIISDMDDTLLNDEGKLSDYTVATLRECIRRGIHVIPASGRTQTSVAPYAAQIGVDILKAGGNAVDAAVAMIYAVGLLEPAASGIGGAGRLQRCDLCVR